MSDRLSTLPLVVLYLTDGCNSRCVTCDIWRNPRRNMRLELIEEIASSFKALQVRWVLLSGGEAMQHPQWPQIAKRLRAEGTYITLLTNGLLLRKQVQDVNASVDEVIVSLDGGTAETYMSIRGVDGFELILDGIRSVREGGIPVSTRTTLQRANYKEVPQIIDVAKAADVNRISFLTVDISNQYAFGSRFAADPALAVIADMGPGAPLEHGPSATALTNDDVTIFENLVDDVTRRYAEDFASGLIAESPEKLKRMVSYFRAINGDSPYPRHRCNSPHISTVIEVDGTIRPCYFLPSYGKISRDDSLYEVLNSAAAQTLRRSYREGHRSECERCVCPLYKGPRALLRM
ncbi:MAG: radical SAM protein [Anaerolineae bacterium]